MRKTPPSTDLCPILFEKYTVLSFHILRPSIPGVSFLISLSTGSDRVEVAVRRAAVAVTIVDPNVCDTDDNEDPEE